MIDCTNVKKIVEEFAQEIISGKLNILCYRSGLKFDIFGMDNFAGAPFLMLNNGDKKWSSFDCLLNDPALQTDRHSLNWFCFAYRYASEYLQLYRKQIFENTRKILDRVPKRLFNPLSLYRIIPIEESAIASFIDIKVSGPFHKIRASVCVGGELYLKGMEAGQPIFYRRSIGFSHANFGMLFDENYSTLRLTVGLDPAQIELFADCFQEIDRLNDVK